MVMPAHKPTRKSRQAVELMKACGEPEVRIAAALDIHLDTLRTHYADELLHGIGRKRREILYLLLQSAKDGNVSAQKALAAMTGTAAAEASFDSPQPSPEKLGKKEQALRDAAVAGQGTEWGGDLEPQTVN